MIVWGIGIWNSLPEEVVSADQLLFRTCKIKSVSDRQDLDAFMCSVFIYQDLHYWLYIVFSKFNIWLRIRGSALCLALAPKFFFTVLICTYFVCLLWLPQIKCMVTRSVWPRSSIFDRQLIVEYAAACACRISTSWWHWSAVNSLSWLWSSVSHRG